MSSEIVIRFARQDLPRVEGRVCGSCTACCKALGVIELHKPTGVWCEHCAIGEGCRIYPDRPPSCAGYKCLWRGGYFDDGDRPDKLKAVFSMLQLPAAFGGLIISVYELGEKSQARRIVQGLLRAGYLVMLSADDRQHEKRHVVVPAIAGLTKGQLMFAVREAKGVSSRVLPITAEIADENGVYTGRGVPAGVTELIDDALAIEGAVQEWILPPDPPPR